ncbi:two-component hybrid sensor and regulator [Roseobacter sp. SK209-2-6]|uniref:PAS domain-containing hybrid sensor histidine kinase/response regulator n=1 Tax=Roseobacter sp. SK209-2-6 TaxID=388739 RepID=UPI0000F3C305|nr:hybrid sensor histidine kinase/response regulator [Roseobacter sp. SK209-2-6]EBA15345.1 two-component hybrid sensor and regulator [Roseobacter sp. SK209-2-6]
MDSSNGYSCFPGHASLEHFNHLATPLWIFDVERHGIWWANPAAIQFWEGRDLQDLLERDFSSDSDTVRQRLRQIVRHSSGDHRLQDTWTLYPQGVPKTVLLSFLPVLIEEGVSAVLIEVKQFVDQFADEEAIRILEAARVSALMVSTYSYEGKLLVQNPAALSCYGKSSAMLSSNDLEARLKDPEVARALLQIAKTGKTLDTEQLVRTQQGNRVHRIRARRGRDPVTGGFVTILSEEDVTEQNALRLRMEELNSQLEAKVEERTKRLRESEERYALATQSAAIWDWDIESDHLFLSPGFVSSLGYEAADFRDVLVANGISAFLHPEDFGPYQEELERHLKEPDVPFNHEHRFRAVDGSYRWFAAHGKCLVNNQGRSVRSVGLLTDVTDRKELEATLFEAQRLEAIGQLTGGIAHDFNNLLTVIQGNAELLKVAEDPDHELADAIKEAAQKGGELTRQLLAFSRKQPLQPEAVNLSELVPDLAEALDRILGDGIKVHCTQDSGLWPVFADSSQFESALFNLAMNARDAMPDGGSIEISCRNRIWTNAASSGAETGILAPGDYVEIALKDTGSGMSAENLQRAVEPYFTTKGVGEGSGLGLSMVFGFSRQSGGDTRIESCPGKGTRVSLFLPRSQEKPRLRSLPRTVEILRGSGEHVHLLEDDNAVQGTLRGILETLNYEVSASTTVSGALRSIGRNPRPALVLADVVLPGGDSGVDLAHFLENKHPEIRVVLMSGFPQAHLEGTQKPLSNFQFLQKPMEKAHLARALRNALDG